MHPGVELKNHAACCIVPMLDARSVRSCSETLLAALALPVFSIAPAVWCVIAAISSSEISSVFRVRVKVRVKVRVVCFSLQVMYLTNLSVIN